MCCVILLCCVLLIHNCSNIFVKRITFLSIFARDIEMWEAHVHLWEKPTFLLSGAMVPRGLRKQSCQNGLSSSHQADSQRTSAESDYLNSSHFFTGMQSLDHMPTFSHSPQSHEILSHARSFMKAPISSFRGHITPYTCSLCGKGYVSHSGLSRHMLLHEGKTYMCPVCDAKFTQKSSMKTHLRGIHKSSQCPQCSAILLTGPDFNEHVLNCK